VEKKKGKGNQEKKAGICAAGGVPTELIARGEDASVNGFWAGTQVTLCRRHPGRQGKEGEEEARASFLLLWHHEKKKGWFFVTYFL
jgi:hypothetical protein